MYLGIDLGGTNISVGLVNENKDIIARACTKTMRHRGYKEIIADMALLCSKILNDANVNKSDIKSIGVGSPGSIDPKNKCIIYASNLTDFVDVNIENELNKYFDIPVFVENDANAALLGEMIAGAGKDYNNVVMITIGTGIGCGIVIDGKLYSGFKHAGGEFGHSVIVADGNLCGCGRRGCFETYASANALISQTKDIAVLYPQSIINKADIIDGKTAFVAARANDEAGILIVDKYINYLAIGITNIVNTLQPQAVILGGGVCNEGEYLLKPLREHVKKYSYYKKDSNTILKKAMLGNDAGIIGAAMLCNIHDKS